ncbi:MAG: hypothetical protein FJY67_00565 [Calditrichaeota bacterium]|nr:hypothetical protein [Calditrichota bacterium]
MTLRRITFIASAILLIVGLLAPSDAQAVRLQTRILELIDEEWVGQYDASVQFRIEVAPGVWGDWVYATQIEADYYADFQSVSYRWQVRLTASGLYTGFEPEGDLQTYDATDPQTFDWKVEERQ